MNAFHPQPVPCRNCGTILQATYAEENEFCCPQCLEPVCYVCGCSDSHACTVTVTNADKSRSATYQCSWPDVPGICSHCHSRAAYEFYQEVTGQPADDPYYLSLGRTVRGYKTLSYGV